MVYKLADKYKKEGEAAYQTKKIGRHRREINKSFIKKVVELRETTDYGSEKLHFVLKRTGFGVSQRQIQRILDMTNLTEPCEKRRGQRKYVRSQYPLSNVMWHTDWSQYLNK